MGSTWGTASGFSRLPGRTADPGNGREGCGKGVRQGQGLFAAEMGRCVAGRGQQEDSPLLSLPLLPSEIRSWRGEQRRRAGEGI